MNDCPPKIARQTSAIAPPRSAGLWFFTFSHWSIRMITNSAVMQKSMPAMSHGIRFPITQPHTVAAAQYSQLSSATPNITSRRFSMSAGSDRFTA